jgi:hypothetical protein
LECPILGRHQRGAETATGVPYDSVEEPKKNPVKQEAIKYRWNQKPKENLGGQEVREDVEARHPGNHGDYRTGWP